MGRFSNPREKKFSQPEEELDLDFDLDFENDLYSDLAESPLYTDSNNAPVSRTPVRKKSNITLICLCSVVAVLLLAIVAGMWFVLSGGLDDGLILQNVTVAGVDVGGMTPEQATAALQQATALTYTQQDMEVTLPDTVLTLSPADTGAKLDVAALVEAAYNHGRSGTRSENAQAKEQALTSTYAIPVLPYLSLNTDHIRSVLDEYCANFNSEYTPSSLTVNGTEPVLDTSLEEFDGEAPCQTVLLEMGTPGRYVDPDKLYDQVMAAYANNEFSVTVSLEEAESIPESLQKDVLALYESARREPVDAVMDKETFEVSCEIYGYDFDLDAVLEQMETAAYGDTLEFQFRYIIPENTKTSLESVLFRDELAYYQTTHTKNQNRNTNLTLACAAINGLILNPGDVFDYNTVVGKRTAEAGYKAADAYDAGQTVKVLGGGICQVSSTLYYCTLIADLEIVTRTAHSYVSSYMPLGMDATVSWGGPEFAFRNNTNYPIRIEAEVSDGYVKIRLVGTDEKDYYVEMEYEVLSNSYATTVYEEYAPDNEEGYKDGQVITTPYNGCTVQSYKCKYDKETKELISREKEALSKYKKRDKVIVKIVTPSAPTEAPTTAPTEAPAQAPTEAPT